MQSFKMELHHTSTVTATPSFRGRRPLQTAISNEAGLFSQFATHTSSADISLVFCHFETKRSIHPFLSDHILECANCKRHMNHSSVLVYGVQSLARSTRSPAVTSATNWTTAENSFCFPIGARQGLVDGDAPCSHLSPVDLSNLLGHTPTEHPGHSWEPEELYSSPSCNYGKQNPSLPEWQGCGQRGAPMPPEDQDSVDIEDQPEEDEAYCKQHSNKLRQQGGGPVSYKKEQVQKGCRCLH
mmetsp:Transcript_53672/g.143560  ORF Transcript_53672/g.143560 Transcript_53672/m.143560 type:complete len:241 (+) Transcript_53672:379-1101(+)